MLRQLIAVVLAVLINCAVLASFYPWRTAAIAHVVPTESAGSVVTLPTITVRPTRAQVEMLRRMAASTGTGDAGVLGSSAHSF
jgi:hypothetical protein